MAQSNTELNTILDENDTLTGKYLTFWTDNQLYGVPIADVVQIVGIQEITPIPEYPHYAKGIINLRGIVIPIIDIRLRFGKEEAEYNDHTCIIVANIKDNDIGFVVDEVDEVADIGEEGISKPPHMVGDITRGHLTGIVSMEGRTVLLLDTQKVIGDEEIGLLAGLGI